MGLIKCKECGKEISSTAKQCPHCGYKERKKVKISKKKIIISSFIIIALAVAGMVIFFLNNKPLTDIEKKAVECIADYKSMLKNRESLQVHDIRFAKSTNEDNGEKVVEFYIDESGQNGFGGNTRSVIRYVYHEDGRVTYTGSDEDEDSDNIIERVFASKIKKEYPKLLKDDNAKVSIDRVMKEVDKK